MIRYDSILFDKYSTGLIYPIFVHFDCRLHIPCIFLYYSNTVRILYNAYTTGFEIFVKNGQIFQVNVEKC